MNKESSVGSKIEGGGLWKPRIEGCLRLNIHVTVVVLQRSLPQLIWHTVLHAHDVKLIHISRELRLPKILLLLLLP